MKIRFAEEANRAAVTSLWELCFPDDSGFNAYYLQHLLSLPNTLILEENGTLAAMLQMLPYEILLDGCIQTATYIYGACTHPQARRRHFMSHLLEESFRLDRICGRAASMLIPQEAWLFDFYRQFGYETAFYVKDGRYVVVPCAHAGLRHLSAEDVPALNRLYQSETQYADPLALRSAEQWRDQIALFEARGVGAFGLMDAQNDLIGAAFVWRETDGLWVQEALGAEQQILCQALAAQTGESRIRVSGPGLGGQALGCLRLSGEQALHTQPHGYFNLMLN